MNRKIPVYLNVYDISPANGVLNFFGFGLHHTGVEILGREYAYGGGETDMPGVFECDPRQAPNCAFKEQILLGEVAMTPTQIQDAIVSLAAHFPANKYHLLEKNCNHFSDALSLRLLGKSLPPHVNRAAQVGASINRSLPERFRVDKYVSVQPPTADSAAAAPAPERPESAFPGAGQRLGQ